MERCEKITVPYGSIAILPDEIHMLLKVSNSFGQLIL